MVKIYRSFMKMAVDCVRKNGGSQDNFWVIELWEYLLILVMMMEILLIVQQIKPLILL